MKTNEFHSHDWWIPYIKEYLAQDKTIREFCAENHFKESSFYRHLRIEREMTSVDKIECIPVVVEQVSIREVPSVTINGAAVSSDIETLRKLLGIEL